MPPPDPRLDLHARSAARTERDPDRRCPGGARVDPAPVELEQQPSQHAAARGVAVGPRADNALAADRSCAEDVHADVGPLAVGGRRGVREDDVETGPAGDGRRRTGEAAVGEPLERADPVVPVPAVECRATARVAVADEDVIPAEAADRTRPDQDVGAFIADHEVIARLRLPEDARVLHVGADPRVLAGSAVVALAVEGHRERPVAGKRRVREDDGVGSGAARERVGTAAALERVAPGAALERIDTGAADQPVAACAAVDGKRGGRVERAAREKVEARAEADREAPNRALHVHVVAARAAVVREVRRSSHEHDVHAPRPTGGDRDANVLHRDAGRPSPRERDLEAHDALARATELARAAALAAGAGDGARLVRPLRDPDQKAAAAGLCDRRGDALALRCLVAERAARARDRGSVGECRQRGDGKQGDQENAHRPLNVEARAELLPRPYDRSRWPGSSRVSRSDPAWARASGSRRAFISDAATVTARTTRITISEVEVSTSGIESSCRWP